MLNTCNIYLKLCLKYLFESLFLEKYFSINSLAL